jgi:hypothetical protein
VVGFRWDSQEREGKAVRPSIILAVMGALLSLGAEYQTRNFIVSAPTPQIAQTLGQWAEHYRKAKALEWLGQEMPPWPEPCPLRVTVSMNGSGGATSFAFDRGRILSQDMQIEGSVDRLVASVLPHEVTHTVFAHYFRMPLPRWADEGGSVLSEDDIERARHDRLVREILQTPGRAIPLRRLFVMSQYPKDVMVLYAEGYSVTSFLVSKSNRSQFLAFIARGMRGDWDGAAKQFYGYDSVEALEGDWMQYLRNNRPTPPTILASNPQGQSQPQQVASNRIASTTRTTAPPVDPFAGSIDSPVVRGAMPEEPRSGTWNTPPHRPAPPLPGILPPPPPVQFGIPRFGPQDDQPPAPVKFGTPQFGPPSVTR